MRKLDLFNYIQTQFLVDELNEKIKGILLDNTGISPIFRTSPYNQFFRLKENNEYINSLMNDCGKYYSIGKNNAYEKEILLRHHSKLLEVLEHNIIKLEQPMTLRDIIPMVTALYNKQLKNNLYGILIKSTITDIYYNPLNPLTAILLLQKKHILEEYFHVMIYSYTDKEKKSQKSLLRDYYNYRDIGANISVDISKIKKSISDSLLSLNSQFDITNITENLQSELTNNSLNMTISSKGPNSIYLNYKIYSKSNSQVDDNINDNVDNNNINYSILIPHQILNKSIVFPMYGATVVTTDKERTRNQLVLFSPQAKNISPILSPNIDIIAHKNSNPITKMDHSTCSSALKRNLLTDNICTGNVSKYTEGGLQTLSHLNLNSPYIAEIFQPGFIEYVDESIKASLNIYSKITKEKNENN